MKILKEDIIIPNVIDAIDVDELTPEGPEQGLDTAIADLILNSITTSTQKLQEYNVLNANLGNNEELRNILTDIMADENGILGKLQTMLKVVSPNAVEIMNGAVEAEDFLSESYLKEYVQAVKGDQSDKAETDALNNKYSGPVDYKSYTIKSFDRGKTYKVFKGKHVVKSGIDTFVNAKEYINRLDEDYNDYDSNTINDYDSTLDDKEVITFTNFYEIPKDCIETYEEGYVLYSPSTDKLYRYIGN